MYYEILFLAVQSEWFWYYTVTEPMGQCAQYMEDYCSPYFTYQDFGSQLVMDFYDPDEIADIVASSGAKYCSKIYLLHIWNYAHTFEIYSPLGIWFLQASIMMALPIGNQPMLMAGTQWPLDPKEMFLRN